MGDASSLWEKVALRDAGPRELEGDGDVLPVDLAVATEYTDSLARRPAGPRCLMVRAEGQGGAYAAWGGVPYDRLSAGLRVVSDEPHVLQFGAWGLVGIPTTPVVLEESLRRNQLPVGVPRLVRVHVNGPVPAHVGAVDLVLHLISQVGFDGYAGAVLEFQGDGFEGLPAFLRAEVLGAASLTNCLTALAPLDEKAIEAARRAGMKVSVSLDELGRYRPDEAARYKELAILNGDQLIPRIADPGRGVVGGAGDWAGKALERVLVGGCLAGDRESLSHVTDIVEETGVAGDTKAVVVAASETTLVQAREAGLADRLEKAGAHLVGPGHVPPARGLGLTLTTNPCLAEDALVASLSTVAASAAAGRVRSAGGWSA